MLMKSVLLFTGYCRRPLCGRYCDTEIRHVTIDTGGDCVAGGDGREDDYGADCDGDHDVGGDAVEEKDTTKDFDYMLSFPVVGAW